MMAFRRSDLQEAFFVPGAHAFRVWGYGTTDPLEEVLRPGYFALARGLLRSGELIYVSTCPEKRWGSRAEPGEPRIALLMFQADDRAAASVRLVQDFGGPHGSSGTLEQPAAPVAAAAAEPVKRGRGRPPGSRTKRPASLVPAE